MTTASFDETAQGKWSELSGTWLSSTSQEERLRAVLEVVDALRAQAKQKRDLAVDGFDPEGNFLLTERHFLTAIELLSKAQTELTTLTTEQAAEIRCRLAHCYGSLGGSYRDAGHLMKAIKAYDQGWKLQTSTGTPDTYTELQRLITRILHAPKSVEAGESRTVEDVDVHAELTRLLERLDRDVASRPPDDDDTTWAMADLATVRILLGATAEEGWKEFARQIRSRDAYEANYKVFRALVRNGVAIPGVEQTRKWLKNALASNYGFSVED